MLMDRHHAQLLDGDHGAAGGGRPEEEPGMGGESCRDRRPARPIRFIHHLGVAGDEEFEHLLPATEEAREALLEPTSMTVADECPHPEVGRSLVGDQHGGADG